MRNAIRVLLPFCLLFGQKLLAGSAASQAEVWLTTIDQKHLLERQANEDLIEGDASEGFVIQVDETKVYQTIDGFGASWTDASAWLWSRGLTADGQKTLIDKLFGRNGIKLSMLRQPIAASDYNWEKYSYADQAWDWDLSSFSIDRDRPYILPALKQSLAKNPDIKVIAAPWSPPGWMKTSGSMVGGTLKPECYPVYSQYLVKFLEAYRAAGVPIYAMSVQNEPRYSPAHYPGMKMSADEQIAFINNDLGPLLDAHDLQTKLLAYDHNFDDADYPKDVLDRASRWVAGSAWHPYTTDAGHEVMKKVRDQRPDKGIWFTEASGGNWIPPFKEAFMDQMMHTIRAPRNWAKSVIFWNIALDQNHGPSLLGKGSTARGVVTIRSDRKDAVSYNPDYYALGHSSKFVEKDARRVESSQYMGVLETVAYRNPNGSIVLVMQNRGSKSRRFVMKHKGKHLRYELPGFAALTIKWK